MEIKYSKNWVSNLFLVLMLFGSLQSNCPKCNNLVWHQLLLRITKYSTRSSQKKKILELENAFEIFIILSNILCFNATEQIIFLIKPFWAFYFHSIKLLFQLLNKQSKYFSHWRRANHFCPKRLFYLDIYNPQAIFPKPKKNNLYN